jgi:hypothetical protein
MHSPPFKFRIAYTNTIIKSVTKALQGSRQPKSEKNFHAIRGISSKGYFHRHTLQNLTRLPT